LARCLYNERVICIHGYMDTYYANAEQIWIKFVVESWHKWHTSLWPSVTGEFIKPVIWSFRAAGDPTLHENAIGLYFLRNLLIWQTKCAWNKYLSLTFVRLI